MNPFSKALVRSQKRKGTSDAVVPPSKRKRTLDAEARRALGGPAVFTDTLHHPLGVQPLGNLYLADSGPSFNARDQGLGIFAILFDDLLLLLLRYRHNSFSESNW